MAPAIIHTNRYRRFDVSDLTVHRLAQDHVRFNAVALAVLVILVIPHLCDRGTGQLGGVGVGQRRDRAGHIGLGQLIVFGQLAFRPGVFDFLAVFVLGQVINRGRPVVGFVQLDFLAVGQGDGQRCRTLAVLVGRVVPGLLNRCAGQFGCVAVGDRHFAAVGHFLGCLAVAGIAVGICQFFTYAVDDLHAALVYRQVVPGMAPAIIHTNRYRRFEVGRRAIHRLAQDHVRFNAAALAVLILRVVPHLRDRYTGLFRRVAVRHVHALHNGGVAGHGFFLNSVLDLSTSLVLGQFFENPAPVICGGYRDRATDPLAVGQQTDADRIRPLAVLIVLIFPCLGTADINSFGRVAVRHLEAVHAGLIVGHNIFRDGVFDFLTVFELGQVFKFPDPFVRCGHFLHGSFFAIGQQTDDDVIGTLAVLILRVIPHLLDCHAGQFGRAAVGDGKAGLLITGHLDLIVRQRFFVDGILDLFAVLVLGQSRPAEAPADVGFRPCHFFSAENLGFAVFTRLLDQVDNNAVGAETLQIVFVVPDLGYVNIDSFQRVGDRKPFGHVAGNLEGVAGNSILGDSIINLHAILVLGQVFEDIRPTAVFVRGDCNFIDDQAVRQQLDSHDLRTGEECIIRIARPHLRDRYVGQLGGVGVRQRRDGAVHAGIGQLVAFGQLAFRPGVGNLLSVFIILRQPINRCRPVVCCTQGLRLAIAQRHQQAAGAQTVLVKIVIPGLCDRRAHGGAQAVQHLVLCAFRKDIEAVLVQHIVPGIVEISGQDDILCFIGRDVHFRQIVGVPGRQLGQTQGDHMPGVGFQALHICANDDHRFVFNGEITRLTAGLQAALSAEHKELLDKVISGRTKTVPVSFVIPDLREHCFGGLVGDRQRRRFVLHHGCFSFIRIGSVVEQRIAGFCRFGDGIIAHGHVLQQNDVIRLHAGQRQHTVRVDGSGLLDPVDGIGNRAREAVRTFDGKGESVRLHGVVGVRDDLLELQIADLGGLHPDIVMHHFMGHCIRRIHARRFIAVGFIGGLDVHIICFAAGDIYSLLDIFGSVVRGERRGIDLMLAVVDVINIVADDPLHFRGGNQRIFVLIDPMHLHGAVGIGGMRDGEW